jgi:hypothetical protein
LGDPQVQTVMASFGIRFSSGAWASFRRVRSLITDSTMAMTSRRVDGSVGRQPARSGMPIQAASLRDLLREIWLRLAANHRGWDTGAPIVTTQPAAHAPTSRSQRPRCWHEPVS